MVLFDRRGNPIKANEQAVLAIEAVGGRMDLAGGGRVPALAAARLGASRGPRVCRNGCGPSGWSR